MATNMDFGRYWYDLSLNVPIEDVRRNPGRPWDRIGLSGNPGVTIEDVEKDINTQSSNFPYMPNATSMWDWCELSRRLPIVDAYESNYLPWQIDCLSENKELKVEDIRTLVPTDDLDLWDWEYLSRHMAIDEIRANPDLPWDRWELSENKGLTIQDIRRDLSGAVGTWNWDYLSEHLLIEYIRQNPDLPWRARGLSKNPAITIEDIQYI